MSQSINNLNLYFSFTKYNKKIHRMSTGDKENINDVDYYIKRESLLLSEYKITNHYSAILGIFVFPDKNDIGIWHGFIILREGLYKSGKFKFVIEFPTNFPKSIPNLYFKTQVFHPLIDQDK